MEQVKVDYLKTILQREIKLSRGNKVQSSETKLEVWEVQCQLLCTNLFSSITFKSRARLHMQEILSQGF